MNEGMPHADRSFSHPMYMQQGDGSVNMGGVVRSNDTMATLEQYENIFGPAARDIKLDNQRNKRHQRWHLPDVLKGPNTFLTDRVDGLITDATNSPFTRNILPYVYLENPDQKLKWNVYNFDEGIASRVPYEAAARVLPQTKRTFSGYVVRHGLAIAMEHNFMVSAAGRDNFKRQLMQLVGSIQLTNDFDVHVALLQAPSYQKTMDEKYHDSYKNFAQHCRSYSDQFGMLQKVQNGLDILIEDCKKHIRMWGGQEPTFMLCNGAITAQLTMLPEKTNYVTNGPDGKKRLAQGPDLPSYRGLSIIHTRQFSVEEGTQPRDIMRRRVRVGQYYWVTGLTAMAGYVKLYDQNTDTMKKIPEGTLRIKSGISNLGTIFGHALKTNLKHDRHTVYAIADTLNVGNANASLTAIINARDQEAHVQACDNYANSTPDQQQVDGYAHGNFDYLIIRPNIEHYMLGAIVGRGGTQELGCTFWGQTELSCYDDAQHGIWGMSYKYHERAMVLNEKNLMRMFDIAFDGYVGGMDTTCVNLADEDSCRAFREATYDRTTPYSGDSMVIIPVPRRGAESEEMPNPMLVDWTDYSTGEYPKIPQPKSNPDRGGTNPKDLKNHFFNYKFLQEGVRRDAPGAFVAGNPQTTVDPTSHNPLHFWKMYCAALGLDAMSHLIHSCGPAGEGAINNLSDVNDVLYQGTMVVSMDGQAASESETRGTGHLGPCWAGVASVREGRGINMTPQEMPKMVHVV